MGLKDWDGFIDFMFQIKHSLSESVNGSEWRNASTKSDVAVLVQRKCIALLEALYDASKAEWDAESRALHRPCQFMFHGADIMIDADAHFWLLEVNRCASISLVGTQRIKQMTKAMLSEMVDIELEIRNLKMNGRT